MQQKFQHFIVTRLGHGIYDEDRLKKLTDLFEAVTLPSVINQTNQSFIWLVSIDSNFPETVKSRMAELLSPHPNYILVPIDVTELTNVRLACFDWVWDHYQDFILENRLLIDPHEYIITSVLDADDAWHRDVIATVNKLVIDRLPGLSEADVNRGTWLRHSSGLAITFPHGYAWFISDGKIWPIKQEFRSMAVFVASRFTSGISACSCRHTKWRQYAEILEFEVIAYTHKEPMWIYTRHGEAVGQWDSKPAMPMPLSFEERLRTSFGIDIAKAKVWCAQYSNGPLGEKNFNDHAAIQFDLFFQIAGLNRKMRALSRRTASDQPNEVTGELDRCAAERKRLVALLRDVDGGSEP
jgi:hypothetical protein